MGNALCAPCIKVYEDRRYAVLQAQYAAENKNIEGLEGLVQRMYTESNQEAERLAAEIDTKQKEIDKVVASEAPPKTKSAKLTSLTLAKNELDEQLTQQNKRLAIRGRLVTMVAGAKNRVQDGRDLALFSDVAADVPAMRLTDLESKVDRADDIIQELQEAVQAGESAGQSLDADQALATAEADVVKMLSESKVKQQQQPVHSKLKEANSSHAADVARVAVSRKLGLGTKVTQPPLKSDKATARAGAMAMT